MPPRFTFWTIIIDGQPTAFRAAEREELLPTLNQLKTKNPGAELKWFARGRVWESPEESRGVRSEGETAAPDAVLKERRARDWRPGGEHKDPREKFKKETFQARKRRDKKAANLARETAGVPPMDHGDQPQGGDDAARGHHDMAGAGSDAAQPFRPADDPASGSLGRDEVRGPGDGDADMTRNGRDEARGPAGDRPQGGGFGPRKPYGDRPQGGGSGYGGGRGPTDRPQGGGFGPRKPYGDRPQGGGSGYGGGRGPADRPQGGGFDRPRGPGGGGFDRPRGPGGRGPLGGPRTDQPGDEHERPSPPSAPSEPRHAPREDREPAPHHNPPPSPRPSPDVPAQNRPPTLPDSPERATPPAEPGTPAPSHKTKKPQLRPR